VYLAEHKEIIEYH